MMDSIEPNPVGSPACPERRAIQADLLQVISDFVELTFQQIAFLKADDRRSALALVTDLDRKSKQEQQTYDTLLSHVKEHGCWK